MRGDYVEVTYRAGQGIGQAKVIARADGRSVEVTEPRKGEAYLVVTEVTRQGNPVRVARFAASEVISVIEGHEPTKREKR